MCSDVEKLPKATREKATASLRTALELSDAAKASHGTIPPLSTSRYAETSYVIGSLLVNSDANEAMKLFRDAQQRNPREPKYATAVAQLKKGAAEYHRQQREQAAEEERQRLKKLEDAEDAEWEEDGLEF